MHYDWIYAFEILNPSKGNVKATHSVWMLAVCNVFWVFESWVMSLRRTVCEILTQNNIIKITILSCSATHENGTLSFPFFPSSCSA